MSDGLTITPGVPPHRHPAGSVTGLAAIATSGSSADITDATAAGRSLLTAVDAAAQRTALSVPSVAQVAAGYQPLDADLTAIAALTTTSYGRSLLTGADAAATRTLIGLAAIAASGSASDLTSGTLADARLSANVARLNVANTWSENQLIQTATLARVMAKSTGTGTSASTNYAAINVQNDVTKGITLGIGGSGVTSTLFGLLRSGLGELITDNSAAGLLIAHAHTSGDIYLALSSPGIALQLVNSSLSTGSAQVKYTTAATSTTAAALTVAGGLGVGGGAVFGGLITIERASSANGTFQSRVVGDSVARCLFEAGGRLLWSSGSSAGDTTLYRSAAGILKTDGVFQVASTADGALSVAGKITAKAAVPASFADLAAVRAYLASILT